ncbi:MAG: glycogen/starch synthase [Thermoanaerobaculia bacterium]|nr:glycogen/starch synthase [Thermoanaerobaculia bacterium]
MIQVLHISAECYPAAKTGGLGDVVGSLPKYMTQAGVLSAAIIPKYALKWINHQNWVTVYGGSIWINWRQWHFRVQQQAGNTLGYPLFVVDIPGLFDRPGIYNDPSGAPYGDEIERYIAFQQGVLDWLLSFPWQDRPRVLHCHDHHTALIPWMVKHCPAYQQLAPIPTMFTIHNGQYQGAFGWSNGHLLPPYEAGARGLLDWNGIVNPMAAAIKTAWAVTTVSRSYLFELHQNSLGLESLFRQEWPKQHGIINGIDTHVWDPSTDPMIHYRLEGENIAKFKAKNKRVLCEWFGFPYDAPLISFIGRLVGEKGADLLPDTYRRFIHSGARSSFLVLGTGEHWTQNQFRAMAHQFPGRFNAVIDYNESLSHQIYAGSDFLIMPSRVEPCGLNQMYAMRYGAIPIVRSVGGLKDTVPDIGEPDSSGRGIRFDQFSMEDTSYAIYRAVSMWHNDPGIVAHLRERVMAVDFSWENTIGQYFGVYRHIGAQIETGKKVQVPEPVAVEPEPEPAKTQTAPESPESAPKQATVKKQTPKTAKPVVKERTKPGAITTETKTKPEEKKPAEKPAPKTAQGADKPEKSKKKPGAAKTKTATKQTPPKKK